MTNIWNNLRKGTGVIVCIPGDEHNGIQSKRPGVVLKTHPKYITVQLLSTTKSKHDIGITNINYKIQYVRPIYLRNITINQIIGLWYDYKKHPIFINDNSKLMNLIESNPYKASSITLSIEEFLKIKVLEESAEKSYKTVLELIAENEKLKSTIFDMKDKEEELLFWNKDLQEENLKLITQLDLLKSKNRNHG